MKDTNTVGEIIIVLTEHAVLGTLLIPYIAERAADGTIRLIEQAFHAVDKADIPMSDAEREAVRIASFYTEKYLMGVYSREKIVSRFLNKLAEDPERVRNHIRPFIEKKLMEMLELARDHRLPLYQRQMNNKTLYAHHACRIHPAPVESRFTFRIEKDCFHYEIQCFYEGAPLSLTDRKPVGVLTASPAALLLGTDIYFFSHIESNRLLPFTKKNAVSVRTEQIEKYIHTILIPIARYHATEIYGAEVVGETRPCEAELTIEDTVRNEQMLRLDFRYGDQTFTPGSTGEMKKIVSQDTEGRIVFFQRDTDTERRAIRLLTDTGLQQISDVHFEVAPSAEVRSLTEWIARQREMLQASFRLTGNIDHIPYCLDEVRIEQSCSDEPDWFELSITVVIGDMRIPFSRFRRHILEERREFLLPDGRMILLPDEWFSRYANLLEMGIQTDKAFRVRRIQGGIIPALPDKAAPARFPDKSRIEDYPVPKGLKATLRPYQQKGFSWMMQLYKLGFGGCLADDMGLGKTLQTLTLLQYLYKSEEKEVAAREEEKNAATTAVPPSPALAPDPTEAPEADGTGQLSLFATDDEDGLLPPAGEIRGQEPVPAAPPMKRKRAPRRPATLIVVPTFLLHNWKREAKRFTTLTTTEFTASTVVPPQHPERFFGRYHIVFTSYGIMRNHIETLRAYRFEYVVLDESQYIKSSDSLTFRSAIQLQSNHRLTLTGTPIENSLKDLWAQFRFLQPDLLGEESAFQKQFILPLRQGNRRMEARLQQLIAPFLLRRSKKEVAPELPPLTEETIYCELAGEQRRLYEQEKNSLRRILLQQAGLGSRQWDKSYTFSVLNGILRLRQLSCHPGMVLPDFEGLSGKTEQIIETFDTLRSEGHKVLIFSSFVKHLEILAEAFRSRGWKYALLTGATSNRPSEIAHFTEQKDVQAFLISLKAGGVGLNLTQADYVFLIDPWWNPAAEAQAIARAHRIGQRKQVIAYRFIMQESIEEKILALQEKKRMLAETFVADSDILPALDYEEWMGLLQ